MTIAGQMPRVDAIPVSTDERHGDDSGAFHAGRVITVALGHWVHDSYSAFLAPMLIVFKDTLALSNAQAGLLSVFMSAASLLQPLIGGVADRKGARYFVALAPLVTGVIMSLIGLAPSYLSLVILLAIVGLSSACIHAVGPVMAGTSSGRKLGLGMSLWMVGGEAGRFAGPLIVGLMLQFSSMSRMPWLMFGGMIATIALLLTLRDEPGATSHRPLETPKIPLREVLRGRERLLIPIIAAVIIQVLMSAALNTYLPLLLSDEGETIWLASVSLSVLQAAGVVGAFVGGTLSDRFGRRKVLVAAILPTTFLMLGYVSTAGWIRFPLLVVLGFCALSVMPVVMALVLETFPESRALANGAYMALSFIVRSGVVVALGWLGDLFGLRLAFIVSAVVPLLGLPFLLMLPAGRSKESA